MRALLKTEEAVGFSLVHDYEIPEPKDDECQIKVISVSICGSDINVWKWNDTAKVTKVFPKKYLLTSVYSER